MNSGTYTLMKNCALTEELISLIFQVAKQLARRELRRNKASHVTLLSRFDERDLSAF